MPSRTRRTEPRLPAPPAEDRLTTVDASAFEWEPESTHTSRAFVDVDLSGGDAEAVEFERCVFRAARLAGARLHRVTISGCVVSSVDWSNVDGTGGTIDGTRVAGSRMTGLSWPDGLVRDAVFEECRLDYSNWRFAAFDAVRFTGCNLGGADFSGADLRGASFAGCDLSGAQFSAATMDGARFRGCDLAGVGGIASFRGARVHRDDLLSLAGVLAADAGIVISAD